MKTHSIFLFCFLAAIACDAQEPQRLSDKTQKPQRMPALTPSVDSASSRMPVLKPDTAAQENMPVAKPPAHIQPK